MLHRIVIVGGGAGGLELATQLGDRLGRSKKADITLVDRNRTHIWKPLLHEIAAGSMDLDLHELEYLAQARWHHFQFKLGSLEAIDRQAKQIRLSPIYDEDGALLADSRLIPYDSLVLAIGSVSNDFGTPGVAEHCISLDSKTDAERFHRRLINNCIRAQSQSHPIEPGQLSVVIVGAGATGVELAAELHRTIREIASYGFDQIDPSRHLEITIVEAAPRILPHLPERLSQSALRLLEDLGVIVHAGERVTQVTEQGVHTKTGRFIPAAVCVWAAGIKGDAVLTRLDGLEVSSQQTLRVKETLQTTLDPNIFALGDCAACPWANGQSPTVPPRAQAAHQQASLLVKTLTRRLKGLAPLPYRYRDFGSLVSLGQYSTVGSLMGGLHRGSLMLEGMIAGLMYKSLYKMHLVALHGWSKVLLTSIAELITRQTEPKVKLH